MFTFTRSGAARSALLLAAASTFVTPVLAQNAALDAASTIAATAPLRQALAAQNVPLSLEVGALNANWRRLRPDQAPKFQFEKRLGDAENDAEYSTVTRGERITVGDQTYLVAYRTRAFRQLLTVDFGEESVTQDNYLRLLPEQTLWLCLFDNLTGDKLGGMRAFNADTDVFAMGNAAERARYTDELLVERAQLERQEANRRVESDMSKIGVALLQYAGDYDKKLPPMRSSQSMADVRKYEAGNRALPPLATAQQTLLPYIQAPEALAHPTSRQIYRPNLNLSGRVMTVLRPATKVVTFYEAAPAADGTRAILYLDGHVTREREADWPAIRAASDAPAPPLNFGKRVRPNKISGATVTLYNEAATAYQVAQWKNPRHTQTLYLSKSINRVYYRDDKTKQAIFIDVPAKGIVLSTIQAAPFRAYKGYNGQIKGRVLSEDFEAV